MPRSEEANRRRRDEQRANILSAARRVFAREGAAATMAQIAAEAGVSQGLAYRYFANKEAMLRELLEQIARAGVFGQQVLALSGTPSERISGLLTRVLSSQRDRLGMYQLINRAARDEQTPDELRAAIHGMHRRFLETLRQLVVEGQATGEVAPGDPDQLITVVTACLDGLTRLAVTDPERFARMVPDASIVLRLFAPRAGERGGAGG